MIDIGEIRGKGVVGIDMNGVAMIVGITGIVGIIGIGDDLTPVLAGLAVLTTDTDVIGIVMTTEDTETIAPLTKVADTITQTQGIMIELPFSNDY